ncbi:uncharacterized protein J3R85_008190 [Psidium guajava]|nr:uncharacterized protein J3R85_008190 [Psidium guajava]
MRARALACRGDKARTFLSNPSSSTPDMSRRTPAIVTVLLPALKDPPMLIFRAWFFDRIYTGRRGGSRSNLSEGSGRRGVL